jgi:anti-sigma regulatory factor (Ser/Thr protein kinase)
VTKILLEIGASPKEANEVELCAIEAFNNAVEHAYQESGSQTISFQLDLQDDWLTVEVRDQGTQMAPEKLKNAKMPEPDPDDPSTWSVRGRGLAIMSMLMDQVSYTSRNGENTLALRKRLRPSSFSEHG